MSIRKHEEPSLLHFSEWLKQRVLALREAYQPEDSKKKANSETRHINTTLTGSGNQGGEKCLLCKGKHTFNKCKEYKDKKPTKRMEFVKSIDLCFNCFLPGHKQTSCTSTNTCLINKCGKKHHSSLHGYFLEREESQKAAKEKKNKEEAAKSANDTNTINMCSVESIDKTEEVKVINTVSSKAPARVYLQIVPVTIHIGSKKADTYALLDNCAQSTLLREDFFKKLHVKGKKAKMSQGTIKDKAEVVSGLQVSVKVCGRQGESLLR